MTVGVIGAVRGGIVPLYISTFSPESVGVQLAAAAVGAPASAVWPTANRAIYVPFVIVEQVTVVKLWMYNGLAAANGNIDIGIYNATSLSLLVSSGAVATAGAGVVQDFDVTDTALPPGRYYLAASLSSGTDATLRWAPVVIFEALPIATEAAAHPLPATATPVAPAASAYVPLMGLSLRTQV